MVKKLLAAIFLCLASTQLFAHKVEGVSINLQKIDGNTIKVEAETRGQGKKMHANKVRLVSMIDKKVLAEGMLDRKNGCIFQIPKESYQVFVFVGEQDVVKEGPPPSGGFDKVVESHEGRAFNYMLTISLLFLAGSIFIALYKTISLHKKRA